MKQDGCLLIGTFFCFYADIYRQVVGDPQTLDYGLVSGSCVNLETLVLDQLDTEMSRIFEDLHMTNIKKLKCTISDLVINYSFTLF